MTITFSFLVTTFFSSYLVAEQGLSPNTVASYSDCMKLLLRYVTKQFNVKPEAIDIQMITTEVVLDFQHQLQTLVLPDGVNVVRQELLYLFQLSCNYYSFVIRLFRHTPQATFVL